MSQGSRVLQSVEGRRFWLTEEALPSVECETCRWILRSYSFVSGSPVQLPGWPIRGVTSWRPTSRAGKVKGSQNTQKNKKNKQGDARFYFLNPNWTRLPRHPLRKFSVLTISGMNGSIFEVCFAVSSASCVTCPPFPHQKTDLLKQQIGESR